jgi:hypothetical protein
MLEKTGNTFFTKTPMEYGVFSIAASSWMIIYLFVFIVVGHILLLFSEHSFIHSIFLCLSFFVTIENLERPIIHVRFTSNL